jgi:hypothetical protein
MPRKVFTAGEVLAAADVNEFLMDQSVQSFAGTAARGSAIPSPVEGMVSFLEDSNTVAIYDGSDWKNSLKTTGSILQVVQATSTTSVSTTSASYVTTGLTATITPTSTSSKILISTSLGVVVSNRNQFGNWTIFRGTVAGTNLGNGANGMVYIYPSEAATTYQNVALSFLDSPATSSAQTYTVGFKANISNSTIVSVAETALATIILMEVAA